VEQGAQKSPLRVKPVNAQALARAGRFLSAGDDHFAAQRYRDANAQYRSATEAAPNLPEAFFHQGQALLAMGQYELAGKAFQRGMKISDNWPRADFNLTNLYGANQVAKAAHMEAVAAAAGDEPRDGTLLLLVGLQLYFDGEQERAMPFFRKAQTLLPGEELNLEAVLQ
jgi:tetratricopeptide (TPR) repeat protein